MPADITVRKFPECSRIDQILRLLLQTNKALSHDLCPWANRLVYGLKYPLWSQLLAAGLSWLCGILLRTEALLITAILLTIAGVGVALATATRSHNPKPTSCSSQPEAVLEFLLPAASE